MDEHVSKRKKRIVILGSGFAAVYAYLELYKQKKYLNDIEIVWISNQDYFSFVVLLHEVAVGNLHPESIIQPLRALPRYPNATIIVGTVSGLDLDTKNVSVILDNTKKESRTFTFDTCILALGSEVNFFETPGAEKYCLTLKNIQDAKKIKNLLISNFESASFISEREARKKKLHTVIIGGGPTGVELAAEIADFTKCELMKAFPEVCTEASVTLIQRGDVLIPQMDAWYGMRVKKILEKKLGVTVELGTGVTSIAKGMVHVDSGTSFSAETIIWTAGVKAKEVPVKAVKGVLQNERSKQIEVNKFLQIPSYTYVYVVGDMAYAKDSETGKSYPMRAQFAVRMGEQAAKNILNTIRARALIPFFWNDKGFIVSLGKGGSLAHVLGVKFSGPFAWWVYRTAYLMRIIGIKAKLRTVFEWTLNLFYPRDITRL